MKCSECGSVISNKDSDCPICGAKINIQIHEQLPEGVTECRKCGEPIPDGTKFCPYCGEAQNRENDASENIKDPVTCSGCGAVISAENAFCPYCGKAQNSSAEAPTGNFGSVRSAEQDKNSENTKGDGVAIASVVLSVASLPFFIFGTIGVLGEITGLILGILGLSSKHKKGFAIAGIVIGASAILIAAAHFIITIVTFLIINGPSEAEQCIDLIRLIL